MLKLFWVGLQLLFIGLKLARTIDWEWWVVLLPFESWFAIILLAVFVHVLRYNFDGQYRLSFLLKRYASHLEGK